MRTFLSLACALFATAVAMTWSTTALAQQSTPPSTYMGDEPDCREYKPDGSLKQPGDYGYGHKCLHKYYMQLYQNTNRCHCMTGACRPTKYRTGPDGTEQVLIEGHWYSFNEKETFGRERPVPEELWPHEGHVCAYPTGKRMPDGRPEHKIECTIRGTRS